MKTVSVSELKANLSAVLERVARGETVLVSSRGKRIARIAPLRRADAGSDEEALARLEAMGIIQRAEQPGNLDFLKMPRPKLKDGVSIVDALLENREEER